MTAVSCSEVDMDALQRIPTKGKDPAMDTREKAFSRIATRCGSIKVISTLISTLLQVSPACLLMR